MLVAIVTTALVAIGLPYLLFRFFNSGPDISHFPIINPREGSWFSGSKAHTDKWLQNANGLIFEGTKKFGGKPFRVATQQGEKVLLPPKYIEHVKSDPRLSMEATTSKSLFSNLRGFEAVSASGNGDRILHDTVRIKLTQNLTKVTKDLATEMSQVLEKRWGNSTEWHEVDLGQDVFKLVSRLSTRVFLGSELCDNPEWLEMAVNYTIYLFQAVRALRSWPAPLRPVANYFLPECRALRSSQQRAAALIEPIVQARRIARQKPGYQAPNDTLEWMEEIAKGRPYNATLLQLSLTMAAIHTTSDLTKTCLLDVAQHPTIVPELRKEVVSVLSNSGWEKTALYKLQLLDSTIKESQRLKPGALVSIGRTVMEDMTLPDGTRLPRGTDIMSSAARMWDEELYKDPATFDPHRFLKIRQTPGFENNAQLVTTGGDHLAFGHGKHACPGRFFAANEVKIAVAYIVTNYDIRIAGGKKPQTLNLGFEMIVDPRANLEVRKRTPEIDLDALS